ncbi:MAG: efflux RND transporter periplasmic adaptor subunit [Bacteroidota bacterium]
MIRNSVFYILIATSVAITGIALQACNDQKPKKTASLQKHTCSMHPQIVKDGPGLCPICGMDLVPVNAAVENNGFMLSESQMQLGNIKTIKVGASDFNTSKVLNARLIANPELTEVISSRYPGRIEKLYVKEAGRSVTKGQLLFQIYSEELQIIQQDYLLQLRQVAAFPKEQIYQTLRESAKNKLKLFGYSNTQIAALAKTTNVSPLVTVYAKIAGVVNEVNVTEGQYVAEGTSILRLENFSQLWIEADVYPAEASQIRIGTTIKVSVNGIGDQEQTATINFISPQIDPASQLLKVRATIPNKGNLQPGMQATVLLAGVQINQAISLPLDAVIRDENGAHVWVKIGKNTFEPRMVVTGEEDANQIIIISGLENIGEVVISGAYLLSSEFILKKGTQLMDGMKM